MNENLRSEWYVFYEGKNGVEMTRIASDCLGNAVTVAKELASRCNFKIVGVTPDVGVSEDIVKSGVSLND